MPGEAAVTTGGATTQAAAPAAPPAPPPKGIADVQAPTRADDVQRVVSDEDVQNLAKIDAELAAHEAAEEAKAKAPKEETPSEEPPAVEPETSKEPEPQTEADKKAQLRAKILKDAETARQRRQERARLAKGVEEKDRQIAELKARSDAMAKLQEALTKDPLDALRQLGVTDKALQDRLIAKSTPEARALSEVEQIKAIADEAKAQVRSLQETIERERLSATRERLNGEFKALLQDEERYPHASQLEPNLALSTIGWLNQEIAKAGHDPRHYTPQDMADFLEDYQAAYVKSRKKPEAPAAAAKPAAANGSKNDVKIPAKVLTNGTAASGFTRPKNWDELSNDAQLAWMAENLEKLT